MPAPDAFLSYAQRNKRWVDAFHGRLKEALLEKLESVEIWLDTADLNPARGLGDGIENALQDAAALMVVLSDAYLTREWCQKEREQFIRRCGGIEQTDGRLFVIRYDELKIETLPPELNRCIGFKFYEKKDNVIKPVRLMDEEEGVYHDEIYRLRHYLLEAINARRAAILAPPAAKSLPETPLHTTSTDSPAVFLAEVFPDEHREANRTRVENYLISQGIRVVPRQRYFDAPEGYESQINSAMESSAVFVQLIGQPCFPASARFPRGYETWLLEQAQRHTGRGLNSLRWVSRELHESLSQTSVEFQQFARAGDPRACELSEFLPVILQELERQKTRQEFRVSGSAETAGAGKVVVCADRPDSDRAQEVAGLLEEFSAESGTSLLEAEMAQPDADVARVAEALRPAALVVVCDQCPPEWATQRLRDFRRVALGRKNNPPKLAVVVPSVPQSRLTTLPPGIRLIAMDQPNEIRQFISHLQGSRT